MTIEEKAKAYDEALERVKPLYEWAKKDNSPMWSTYEYLFPQLANREDERTRKEILDFIKSFWADHKESIPQISSWIAYLEKQKEPKWSPSEGEMGVLYKLCYLSNQITDEDDTELTRLYQDLKREYFNGHSFENMFHSEKQKELHFTKRNALFDKCVENCDPKTAEEVNKRVDDIMNMPELSAFEQALTNFIGYWEDDEEKWPSKFVKKHGKHILDMAREELQKEQKPAEKQNYSGLTDLERAIHRGFLSAGVENVPVTIIKETANECKRTQTNANENANAEWILPEEFEEAVYKVANFISPFDSQEELRKVSHRFAEQLLSLAKKELDKPAEWSEEDNIGWDEAFACVTKTERAAKDEGELQNAVTAEKWLKEIKFKYCVHPQSKQEWSEDDEYELNNILTFVKKDIPISGDTRREFYKWLKSLQPQPHWKPSEEQMEALKCAVNDSIMMYDHYGSPLKEEVTRTYSENLQLLYEQLKKLM